MLTELAHAVAGLGLIPRGGFHPESADQVPALPKGPAGTVVLIGNAGPALWRAFAEHGPGPDPRNPLESWLEPPLRRTVETLDGHLILPKDGPPYPPIQRWAQRAEPVDPSPLGILIHPDYGLWHAYRGAALFAERLTLPPRDERESPCATCADKPCESACPVDAFAVDSGHRPVGFDAGGCVDHLENARGRPCREDGCLARRACPVGHDYRYLSEQSRFHTTFFRRAMAEHRED